MLGYKLPSRPHTAPTHFHRGRRMVAGASGDTSPRTTSNGACRAQRCPVQCFSLTRRRAPAAETSPRSGSPRSNGRALKPSTKTNTNKKDGLKQDTPRRTRPVPQVRRQAARARALSRRPPCLLGCRPLPPAQACASADSPCLCRTASPPARSSSKALSCRQTRRPRRTAAAALQGRGSAGGGGTRGCLGSGRVRRTESARAHRTRRTKRRC